MSDYEKTTEASFNAGKRHLALTMKWGVPWQIWDAPQPGEPEDRVGADNKMTLEKANTLLAPFNMLVNEFRAFGAQRWGLTVLDGDKPWPSNWSSVADEVVMCVERKPHAKFGRKKWPPKEFTA
jgi:hypothetical protein